MQVPAFRLDVIDDVGEVQFGPHQPFFTELLVDDGFYLNTEKPSACTPSAVAMR
jgi:hypothetical protein